MAVTVKEQLLARIERMTDSEAQALLRAADQADGDEIVVRRMKDQRPAQRDLVAILDTHLAAATRRPAGTTDRLLAADRERPY